MCNLQNHIYIYLVHHKNNPFLFLLEMRTGLKKEKLGRIYTEIFEICQMPPY